MSELFKTIGLIIVILFLIASCSDNGLRVQLNEHSYVLDISRNKESK